MAETGVVNLCACGCGEPVKSRRCKYLLNHHWRVPEVRQRLSESQKGNGNPFYGQKHTKASRLRMASHGKDHPSYGNPEAVKRGRILGLANKGRRHTLEARKKMVADRKGINRGPENPFYGKQHSPEALLKISAASAGASNPAWKGGTTFEPYGPEFTTGFRRAIRGQHEYRCVVCGEPENGRAHHCHHIDYDKRNNSPENLVLLCVFCHGKTSWHRAFWIKLFQGHRRYVQAP